MNSSVEIRANLLVRNVMLNLMGQGVPLIVGALTMLFVGR